MTHSADELCRHVSLPQRAEEIRRCAILFTQPRQKRGIQDNPYHHRSEYLLIRRLPFSPKSPLPSTQSHPQNSRIQQNMINPTIITYVQHSTYSLSQSLALRYERPFQVIAFTLQRNSVQCLSDPSLSPIGCSADTLIFNRALL